MTATSASALACPHCGQELPPEAFQPAGADCPACACHVEAALFPALFRAPEISLTEPVISDEAGCFFHPDRVAAFACSRCGRFLCPFCRIGWSDGDVCASCLEAARKTQPDSFASSRFHFDSAALALSTLPILTWIFSLFTAPVALGFAIFTFRRQCSIAPRSKIRFVLAMLFSALTIAGWVLFFVYVSLRPPHRGDVVIAR